MRGCNGSTPEMQAQRLVTAINYGVSAAAVRERKNNAVFEEEFQAIRPLVLERDEFKCCVCNFDAIIEVHHITARSKDGPNRMSNLITLCPNHHKMAGRGMIAKEVLTAMAAKQTASAVERLRATANDDLTDILPGLDERKRRHRFV